MSQIPQVASTQGSPSFDPDAFFESWANETLTPPYDNDFRKFIIKAFGLRPDDSFVYRAVAEVTLLQAQTYLEFGGQGGLHGWYLDGEGKEVSLFFELLSSFFFTSSVSIRKYEEHACLLKTRGFQYVFWFSSNVYPSIYLISHISLSFPK
jgi:hypothetical protein